MSVSPTVNQGDARMDGQILLEFALEAYLPGWLELYAPIHKLFEDRNSLIDPRYLVHGSIDLSQCLIEEIIAFPQTSSKFGFEFWVIIEEATGVLDQVLYSRVRHKIDENFLTHIFKPHPFIFELVDQPLQFIIVSAASSEYRYPLAPYFECFNRDYREVIYGCLGMNELGINEGLKVQEQYWCMHIARCIDQLAKDCTRGFEVLNLQLKNPAVANIVKSDELARLKNGQSRFTRWKRNAGAHTLDQKLQNNTRVKIQAIRLLSHIQRLLEDAHAITVGDQVPWDQINDEEDSQSEDERESLDSSPETEMEQVLAHIANAIGNLSYLGAALREPLADGRITDETSPYEPFDVQHVRSKYPGVDEVIAERLGKDISARRKLFQGQDSTELSSYPSRGPPADEPTLETLFNELDLEDLNYQGSEQEEIYDENSSQTSYIASEDLRAHQIPPLPQKAADGGPFRCPFCNKMMRGLSTKTWK
ncbi:hypothetical protein NOF04DRAFT_1342905 [Fusarium oxysporum II5]|nr:hypothetical protein NOF04DRAFT_1342905 [Fusarium oxysporum II5]